MSHDHTNKSLLTNADYISPGYKVIWGESKEWGAGQMKLLWFKSYPFDTNNYFSHFCSPEFLKF